MRLVLYLFLGFAVALAEILITNLMLVTVIRPHLEEHLIAKEVLFGLVLKLVTISLNVSFRCKMRIR